MSVSFSQVVHNLVGLVKYAVVLVVLVIGVKVLLPMFWGHACYVDPDDLGMQAALGKTTVKVPFDPKRWNEREVKRGKIVILSREHESSRKHFPFRVIAVAGDLISAKHGKFVINGRKEKYPGVNVVPDRETSLAPQRVPRGYAYVLPDDRRDCMGGHPKMIPVWQIVGKVEEH